MFITAGVIAASPCAGSPAPLLVAPQITGSLWTFPWGTPPGSADETSNNAFDESIVNAFAREPSLVKQWRDDRGR